jgi:hypothetical protein
MYGIFQCSGFTPALTLSPPSAILILDTGNVLRAGPWTHTGEALYFKTFTGTLYDFF